MQVQLLKDYNPPQKEVLTITENYIVKPTLTTTVITPPDPIIKPHKPRTSVFSENTGYELVEPNTTNNCVAYAKSQTGIYRTMGLGGMSAIQGHDPQVGSIGVLKGHAVVVESVDNGLVTFRESNFKKNWITRRTLPENSFLGFIYS